MQPSSSISFPLSFVSPRSALTIPKVILKLNFGAIFLYIYLLMGIYRDVIRRRQRRLQRAYRLATAWNTIFIDFPFARVSLSSNSEIRMYRCQLADRDSLPVQPFSLDSISTWIRFPVLFEYSQLPWMDSRVFACLWLNSLHVANTRDYQSRTTTQCAPSPFNRIKMDVNFILMAKWHASMWLGARWNCCTCDGMPIECVLYEQTMLRSIQSIYGEYFAWIYLCQMWAHKMAV